MKNNDDIKKSMILLDYKDIPDNNGSGDAGRAIPPLKDYQKKILQAVNNGEFNYRK
jgi:hypothetical protein